MSKANLVLHCGARSIDRDGLATIPTPDPTTSWHPISHIHLVNEVERALAGSNMRITNESFGVTEDGAKMFGLLQVENCINTVDYAYVIGLRGAIDKSLSRGLAVGSSVFVCDNLAFSSEIVMHRKQTKNILADLPLMVDTAIGQLGKRWNDQSKRIEAYKSTGITAKDAAYLLMEMAGDVFPIQRIGDIYAEFKTPRHAEFGRDNLWAMFNAVTEFLKPRTENSKATGLWTMPSRTGRLHKVCDDYAGVTLDVTVNEPIVVEPEIDDQVNQDIVAMAT